MDMRWVGVKTDFLAGPISGPATCGIDSRTCHGTENGSGARLGHDLGASGGHVVCACDYLVTPTPSSIETVSARQHKRIHGDA